MLAKRIAIPFGLEYKLHSDMIYHPPISDDLLFSSDFFLDLYPLDGGGALVTPEFITDLDDSKFAHQILKNDALSDFGALPHLDHRRFERWHTVQKSCWLNRFYWIVPLAKQQAITKDKALANLITDTIFHFVETCPAPRGEKEIRLQTRKMYRNRDAYNKMSHEEIIRNETDIEYIWFDFEPASRFIHWIYALRFLALGNGINTHQWHRIAKSLYEHAEILFYSEKYERTLRIGDNHQCLKGLALLYAGTFFQEDRLSNQFLDQGIQILEFHDKNSFGCDGVLKEISPSYHAFQTWHIRDAILLSKQYGFNLNTNGLIRQASFLNSVSDLTENTVVLNDGIPMQSQRFTQTFGSIDNIDEQTDTSYFQDACIATLKRPGVFFLLDCSPFTGKESHYHAGKNAFTLWMENQPFFIDSGCCPYDHERYQSWYRLGEAHSSLLVENQGDGFLQGTCNFSTYATTQCDGWQLLDNGTQRVSGIVTSNAQTWKQVTWKRTIDINDHNHITIQDHVTCPQSKSLKFIFNLHPNIHVELLEHAALLHHGSTCLQFNHECNTPYSTAIESGCCYLDNTHQPNQRLVLNTTGENIKVKGTILRR